MTLILLRYLHFICIFMDAIKSELLTLIFKSDIVRIWVHIKLSPIYYKANALTNRDLHPYPPTTVYLSYLPGPAPCHNLPSNRFPKSIRSKGCFIFFTRDWKKNNKKQFPSVEIGNDFIYINIKTSVLGRYWLHRLIASETLTYLNSTERDS